MRIRKNPEKKNTLQIALIFFLFICFLLFISFTVKAFFIIKNSNFDGEHSFTVLFVNEEKKQSGTVIFFSPQNNEISVFEIITKKELNKDIHDISIGIPIDGYLETKKRLNFDNQNKIADILKETFINRDISTNLTVFDTARLLFFVLKTSVYSVNFEKENITLDSIELADELKIDKKIASLFGDETIKKEKISIGIINATGILGLGNKFSRLINNMGGNVISVTTSDTILEHSGISYYGKKSYTVSKLEKILKTQAFSFEEQNISDIIIILGKDRGDVLSKN